MTKEKNIYFELDQFTLQICFLVCKMQTIILTHSLQIKQVNTCAVVRIVPVIVST